MAEAKLMCVKCGYKKEATGLLNKGMGDHPVLPMCDDCHGPFKQALENLLKKETKEETPEIVTKAEVATWHPFTEEATYTQFEDEIQRLKSAELLQA
jgi:hypothetical protein